jgi:hypothetical protein
MTINIYLALFFVFVSGCGLGAIALAGVALPHLLRILEKFVTANRELGMALGELKDIKNHEVVDLKGRQQILFGLLGSIERHLFLERREGKLVRVIGDTSDLSVFPEMTPALAAEIACLLAKGAGKVVAACAGAPLVN